MSDLLCLLQQFEPGTDGHEEANEWFYSVFIWILVTIPILFAFVLAAVRKKSKTERPHVTDMTWNLDVNENELPVLVHAYHKWSIGDRVIEAQVEKLREECTGRVDTFSLDIEANPDAVGKFPTLGEKCVALFVDGNLVWQAQGVHDHASILKEIGGWISTEQKAAGSGETAPPD